MVEYAQPGDTILLMGARDPSLQNYAQYVQQLLEDEPM
jgi:UDP-N-acetylmuramate--alanine ligase